MRPEIVLAHAGLDWRELAGALAGEFVVSPTITLAQTLAHLEQRDADLLLIDLDLPDAGGPPAIARVRRSFPRLPMAALANGPQLRIRLGEFDCDCWSWEEIAASAPAALIGRLKQKLAAGRDAAPAERLSCRLLLAEHLADRRGAISQLLKGVGARVDQAADGAAALGKALAAEERGDPYCAVLLNTSLPGLGDSVAVALREVGYSRAIVGLDALPADGARSAPVTSAIDEWLRSPIDRPLLLESLRRWMNLPAEPIR